MNADLVGDIQKVTVEYPDTDLLVIGAYSPYLLERMPTNVVAGAEMNKWLTTVEPRSSTPGEMRDTYGELADRIDNALAENPLDAD